MPQSGASSPPCSYRPLMPLVLALMTGMSVGAWLPGYLWIAAGAVLTIAAVSIRNVMKAGRRFLLPMSFCALVGYLAVQPWLADTLPEDHVSRFDGKQYWKIRGRVVETPEVNRDRWRFVLAAEALQAAGRTRVVSGRVLVTGRGDWPGADCGDRVAFTGRLSAIHGFANPGGFDYERFLAFRAIRVRAYAKARSLQVLSRSETGRWQNRLDKSRARLAEAMETALAASEPSTVLLLKALLLGQSGGLPDHLRQDFNRAGVGHVLAISGLHIGMVAAFCFGAATRLLVWIPWVLRRAWARKGAALFSLVPVLGYGMLAGLSPSTRRAVIMVMVFLLGYWVGRRPDRFNTLALAALVILVIYPPALFSISFQLSFVAVLAILAGLKTMPAPGLKSEHPKLGALLCRLAEFVWVSVLAILGTLPLVTHYFNQVSLAGPAVNLVVVPLVGLVVVPTGLAGVAATCLSTDLAALLWKTAALGVDLIRMTVAWTAQWPWASVQCVTPNSMEIGLYYLLAAGLIFRRSLPRPRVVFACLLCLCVVDAGYWTYQRFGRRELRLTAMDVGQGTASLIEFPKGYTALVDGGGFSDNSSFDVGRQIVAPFLWRRKIRTVDLVVLSHANSDHLNGLRYILQHFKVGQVWSNGEGADSAGYKRWQELVRESGAAVPSIARMSAWKSLPGVEIEILAPPPDFRWRSATEPWRDLNNNSLVLRVRYKNVSILCTGDIMAAAETEMLDRIGSQRLSSTILLVPHHGSRSSSTLRFLEAVHPREALISAGWRNRFGFPHVDVLNRLNRLGARTWCTAQDGAVSIVTNGDTYRIAPSRRHQ